MKLTTDNRLKNALVDLLISTPIEKIRVGEISEKSNVSRVTFYKHYLNKEDLLDSLIEDYFHGLDKVYVNNIRVLMHTDFSDINKIKNDLLPGAKSITRYFYNNRKTITALMSPNSGIDFLKIQYNAFYKQFHEWLPQKFLINYDPKTLNEYCDYLTRGSALIIGTWFRKNFEQTPDEIAEILITILSPNFHNLYHKNHL